MCDMPQIQRNTANAWAQFRGGQKNTGYYSIYSNPRKFKKQITSVFLSLVGNNPFVA